MSVHNLMIFISKFLDQWSPINIEGKKQYDREFLMKLQQDPLSMTKPDNLPNMDIIKDKAIAKISSGIPGADKMFTPSFVKPTISNRVNFLSFFKLFLIWGWVHKLCMTVILIIKHNYIWCLGSSGERC